MTRSSGFTSFPSSFSVSHTGLTEIVSKPRVVHRYQQVAEKPHHGSDESDTTG
jgi:hypothetical protein